MYLTGRQHGTGNFHGGFLPLIQHPFDPGSGTVLHLHPTIYSHSSIVDFFQLFRRVPTGSPHRPGRNSGGWLDTIDLEPRHRSGKIPSLLGTTSVITREDHNRISGVVSPYTHSGQTNGTTYFYVVTALNANGESGPSALASAMPQAPPPAPTPTPAPDLDTHWCGTTDTFAYSLDGGAMVSATETFGGIFPNGCDPLILARINPSSGMLNLLFQSNYFRDSDNNPIVGVNIWFEIPPDILGTINDLGGNFQAGYQENFNLTTWMPEVAYGNMQEGSSTVSLSTVGNNLGDLVSGSFTLILIDHLGGTGIHSLTGNFKMTKGADIY